MIGRTVSHYRIVDKLGEGGMGVVYKAEDTKLKRTVALKFLPPELTSDPAARERFVHEARTASALDHPNVCTIHEIGEMEDGRMFIAMACYEGETLKTKIRRGAMAPDQAIRTAVQMAEGLAKAHALGIVHRDIKPANIIVTGDGVVKILDFGLAKLAGQAGLTRTSSTVGTAAYMSPEQVGGRDVDGRSDIWSLGVVLYEMLTGRLPFGGEYEPAVMYSILNDQPRPMSSLRDGVPCELERVVRKTLAKNPEERYESATDLADDLRVLSGERTGELRAAGLARQDAREAGWRGKSVAVLPFRSLSDSREDEYFSDGTTEDIITQLSKVGGLRVISRTSVMLYKQSAKRIPEIGRELGVATILEGSVRRAGGRVRIVAQLLDAATDEHLWAETYDRDMHDIFAVQSDVAEKIAAALKAELSAAERERIQKKPTESTEAYNRYLKGRLHWNRRTATDLEKALDCFNEAIEIDPGYALAYAGLASTYLILPRYAGVQPRGLMLKAEAAAARALELDPDLAEAHAVLGKIKTMYEWDWAGGEREFKRAIELDPNYSTVRHWYSLMLRNFGRFDEALAQSTRAQEIDPLSLVISTLAGDIPYYMGEYARAVEQHKKTLELDPNFAPARFSLGRAYAAQGRLDEAVAEFQAANKIVGSDQFALVGLGTAYARAGRKSEATSILNELLKRSEQGYSVSCEIAGVYLGLGDEGQCLRWIEKAYEERSTFLEAMKVDPEWEGIRSHPRFVAIVKKIGLDEEPEAGAT